MMRGQSPSGSQLGNRSLRRCKSKSKSQSNVDVDVVIVDVDHDVVIVDAPETSEQGSRRSRERRRQLFSGDAIHIVDVDGDIDDTPRNAHGDYAGKVPVSRSFPSTEGSDSDECLMFVPERDFPSKSASKKRIYCKNNSSRNRYGFFHGSESDSSDCEILDDSSGNIREQWEVASLRKGKPVKNRFGSDEQANTFGSFTDPISSSPEETHNKVAVNDQLSSEDKVSASGSCADPISSSPGRTRNKVAVGSLKNKIYLNHRENVTVDGTPNNGNEKSPSRVPSVDIMTEKSPVETGAFGSDSDPKFSSPENFTDTISLNDCEDVVVGKKTGNPNSGENETFNSVPTADIFTDKSPGPSVDIMTEKSPMETGAFGSDSDPKFSSPENFTDTISLNDCEDVVVGKKIGNPNSGENETFNSVPTADIFTDKSPQGTSAFGSFANSKTTHVQVDADFFPNKGYSSSYTDEPVENSRSKSTNGKENGSSNVLTADNLKETPPSETNAINIPSRVFDTDKLTEEPSLKTDANTCIADSNPTCGVYGEPGLQNEGMTSEKNSHGAQSTDGTPFDHKSTAFSDVEVPLWVPSSCNSRLHNKHYVAKFRQKDQIPGERSCDTESWCSIKVEHEVFDFQGKGKSVLEPSISPLSNEPEHNAWGECVNSNKESTFRGPFSNHHQHSGIPEHNAQGDCINCNKESTLEGPISDHHEHSGIPVMDHSSDKASEHLDPLHENLIGERERHKESDEYKRAAEEEWASRLQQLQIQAAEVQQLRRKRKAEKAVLDMEKRQKQRLEEIRESQKKDEETSNLKEKLRADVRKELDQMELRYRDMASLLRGLGIHVEGGAYPVSHEVVNAAYKRALLKFHPDRSSQMDIRQQVEAEEKFKLILRMKKKLLR